MEGVADTMTRFKLIRRWISAGLPKREVIGAPLCPLMYRWTLFGDDARGKVMLHRFPPNTTDADIHDHPWPFVTMVLWGSYDDIVPCPTCLGEPLYWGGGEEVKCWQCFGKGIVFGERMRAGKICRRRAEHTHRTRTHDVGAWTLVITGKKVREWGFWRDGKRWPFKAYKKAFGPR